jgi:hypothetical protein
MPDCKKVKFYREQDALDLIARYKRTAKKVELERRVYFCDHCSNWHITSKPLLLQKQMENMQRQIDNLKRKLEHYKKENDRLKEKLTPRIWQNGKMKS